MGTRPLLLASALCLSVVGCGAVDPGNTWRSGRYRIGWIDEPSQSVLDYDMGGGSSIRIAEPCIFAVGESRNFISFARVAASGQPLVYVLAKAKYDPAREPASAIEGPFRPAEFGELMQARGFPPMRELFHPGLCRSRA